MRIGLFTDSYLPGKDGVAFMVDIARRELTGLGHQVFVVAPRTGLTRSHLEDGVLWIPAIKGILFDNQMTSLFLPSSQIRRLSDLDLDVIIIYTPAQIGVLGTTVAIENDIPLITQYCTDMKEYLQRYPAASIAAVLAIPLAMKLGRDQRRRATKMLMTPGKWGQNRLSNLAIKLMTLLHRQCDAVIAVSNKSAVELRRWHPEIPVHVIPTGINPLPSSAEATRRFKERWGIAADDKVVLYVGRLAREKNLELLIRAFGTVAKKEPRSKLVLVGDNRHAKVLKLLADSSRFRDRIIFTGRYDRSELGSVYKAADIFAFPSVTDTQALVVNEAAQAGLPFAWIDEGLNRLLVDGQTGCRAVRNSAPALAVAILKVLSDESRRRVFGASVKKMARGMKESKQTLILEKLLFQVVKNH